MGFSLGGPMVRNKAFFFTTFDWARKNTPSGFSADGSTGQQFSGGQANIQQVVNIAQNKYGYDPGGLGEFSKPNNSDKVFGRFDFNLSPRHQLTARVNYVDAEASIGNQANIPYKMPSNFYNMTDKMLSSVVQLNSSFGSAFNEFRVTYSRERNVRGGQPGDELFPEVRVDFPDGNVYPIGTEYSSHANQLDQDIVQLSDDVTLVKGQHTFSFGTQNEFYKFYNLFIQNLYGGYRFSNAANFDAGIAQSYNHNFVEPGQPERGGQLQRDAVRLLRRRQVAAGAELHADLRRAHRPAAVPRQAAREPGRGERVRLRHRRGAGPDDVLAARGLQLGSQSAVAAGGGRSAAASACSPAARPTCGCRTSTATPAWTSRTSR